MTKSIWLTVRYLCIAAISLAAGVACSTSPATIEAATWDIDTSSCSIPGVRLAEFNGTVTNNDVRPHDYRVTVGFYDGQEVRLDDDTEIVSDVTPRSTARWQALGDVGRRDGALVCRVTKVEVVGSGPVDQDLVAADKARSQCEDEGGYWIETSSFCHNGG